VRFGLGFRFIARDFREKNPNFLLRLGGAETYINDDDKSRRAHNCHVYRTVDKSDHHGPNSSSRHTTWHVVAKTNTILAGIHSNSV